MEAREIRCQRCGALAGTPCRTASGALTGTHTVRVEQARYGAEQLPLTPDAPTYQPAGGRAGALARD